MGEVSYDDSAVPNEIYWFDISKEYEQFLSTSGNPWLACLLPLAVTLGEPLHMRLPVDRGLLYGMQEVMLAWKCWYPHCNPVSIYSEFLNDAQSVGECKTGAFFSGGVDSFFTLLHHDEPSNPGVDLRVDDLLFVSGFDIPLSNQTALEKIIIRNQMVADELGKKLINVRTNIRNTRFGETDWRLLSHGAALASVALLLEDRYSSVLLGSTYTYDLLKPLGSHPAIDHLFSTRQCKIIHDGAGFSRIEKIDFISQSKLAQQTLHVCWVSRTDENCGICCNCCRTMAVLDIYGVLDKFVTFKNAKFDAKSLSRIYCISQKLEKMCVTFQELRKLAEKKNRRDIIWAVDHAYKRMWWAKKCLSKLQKLKNKPLVGRTACVIYEYIFNKIK
ncbi:MAG: hypothetical protein ACYC0V_05945 [Armatimonadota bacterium]